MADKTVYPYGTEGTLPSSIGLVNDLTTGGVDKALTAQMGVKLRQESVNVSNGAPSSDLEIMDESENILARFSDGHFQVKKFNTKDFNSDTIPTLDSIDEGDLAISDTEGNTILLLSDGHIKTKYFDSRRSPISAIKKAVFMGDSITQGVYSYWNNGVQEESNRYNGFDISNVSSVSESTEYHGIHYYFGLLSGANMVNLGKRGSGWVADTRHIGNALVVSTNFNFFDVDFVALCFGVNDYIQGVTIGDITTRASNTLIGNMCATIEKILTDNPLCKLVVYTPYNTWGQVSNGGDYTSNVLYGSESTNYAIGYGISGRTLQDIIDAEELVCNYYGIQFVNLSKSNVINRFTIKNILVDGLHPTKESYMKLAAEIYGKGNFGA